MRKFLCLFILIFCTIIFTSKVFALTPANPAAGIPYAQVIGPEQCPIGFEKTGCQPIGTPIHAICSNMFYPNYCWCTPLTPTPPLECNRPCTVGVSQCPIECPVCTSSSGGSGTCQAAPTSTPTPTATPTAIPTLTPTPSPTPKIPACGDPCTVPADCNGALTCTACIPNANGVGKSCQVPPACNATCTSSTYCQNASDGCTVCTGGFCKEPVATPTKTPTPSPTKIPACNDICTTTRDCAGAKDGCVECLPNQIGGGKSCQKPPACNDTCVTKDNCSAAKDGCVECLPSSGGGLTCQGIPACNSPCYDPASCLGTKDDCTFCNMTINKCQKPPACGTDCTGNPGICDIASGGCTYCNPTSKKCEARPTATPTPPFDEDMCKCDGLTHGTLAIGQLAKITAYGKVLGVNKNYATIPSVKFRFMSGNNVADQKLIKEEKIPTNVILNTTDLVRYSSLWNLTLPSDLDTKLTYRIQAKVECAKKQAFAPNEILNTAVLATSSNRSFWEKFMDFFVNIFSVKRPASTPLALAPTSTPVSSVNQNEKSLQLKTIRPAVDVDDTGKDENNCTFLKFHF